MQKITLLARLDQPELVTCSLRPILTSRYVDRFDIVSSPGQALALPNEMILVVDYYDRNAVNPSLDQRKTLQLLRDKYRVMAYFDVTDSTSCQQSGFVSWFDLWFKKQIFSNLNEYLTPHKGGRIFADYYISELGAPNIDRWNAPGLREKDLTKIKVAWNLGVCSYPLSRNKSRIIRVASQLLGIKYANLTSELYTILLQLRIGQPASFKLDRIQSRFAADAYLPPIGWQRKIFLDAVHGNHNFLTGSINHISYYRELSNVKAVLSPFGWGEICYRDFEAIRSHAVLIKPNMDHIDTWPSVYQKNETYLDVRWDGSDLAIVAEQALSNSELCSSLTSSAYTIYAHALSQLDQRVQYVINLITDHCTV